jgi:DNA-binding transcriptional regulator WhiA
MAKRWTKEEEKKYHTELSFLYIKKNKSLQEISKILNVPESTIFRRMNRLGIKTQPHLKTNYLKKRNDVNIPLVYSKDLAEFFGIMLGDGHISHFQIVVSLGNKEEKYAKHVSLLIKKIFKVQAKISVRGNGYRDVYLGSVDITSWLFKKGLVSNKVKSQVNVPSWIFTQDNYMRGFLRGFFDTDGSIYRLKYGIQMSFCNRSLPLLKSLQLMLKRLRYNPSGISLYNLYLTRRKDIKTFFEEIKPSNNKHITRYLKIEKNMRRSDSGYSRRL